VKTLLFLLDFVDEVWYLFVLQGGDTKADREGFLCKKVIFPLVEVTGLSSQLSDSPLDCSPKFSQQVAARKIWSFVSSPAPDAKTPPTHKE